MSLYQDLTDDEVLAELKAYRDAVRKVAMGGIARVSGEGRMMEFAQSNVSLAKSALRELVTEAESRGLREPSGGAIAVEFS